MKVTTAFGEFADDDLVAIRTNLDMIREIQEQVDRKKAEISETIKAMVESHKIPKKIINRMVKAHCNGSFDEIVSEDNEFEALYTAIKESV